ncbi:hypothetical protein A9Q99_03630 [Gammaproteobacteria bacterium 45_16_T64]|nr:hypothetical protein A9Q99_03630 [Gammaproteobacteria bacterium 45_16_T64]
MNIIKIDPKTGHTKTVHLNAFLIIMVLIFAMMLMFVGGVFVGGWETSADDWFIADGINPNLRADIKEHKDHVEAASQLAEERLSALSVKMAEVQARVMRLDALGERLIKVAKLRGGEFDFSQGPAVGGPEGGVEESPYQKPNYLLALEQLSSDVAYREQQLEVMESLLANRQLQNEVYLAGRPIKWGWMSSRFGRRNDPFTGRLAWHKGVDFAGKEGSDIISVGSGVVTWAGDRYGYGLMVEVSHGSGLVTRYGHAKEILVALGDIVKKGDTIAHMGSTGRSTGPHVHFEVRKNGKALDPARYVNRRAKG